ncbi:hypothetical protein ACFXOD_32755 [Streptomyces sp. NPDC059161]|uniref:hypothetical protein n=1 Tax=Streptomyces sp. NPDC059161 TaxID=3346749 RepID=UPI0036992162
MRKLSPAELDVLVAEATVDAYGEYEQLDAFAVVIGDRLALPFETTVLGIAVTVTAIELNPGNQITARCQRGRYRQAIAILDLPAPTPRPDGWEWVEAYRHWTS